MAIELHEEEPPHGTRQSLYRFADGSLFAYARRQEFIRCSDSTPWAHISGDRLLSARSGDCLAFRIGNVYYDAASREPLFYELP